MSKRGLLVVLIAVWAAGVLMVGRGTRRDATMRSPEFLMDMAHSPAYEAQGPNVVFADGRNLRSPVVGTVARGFMPFAYAATPEDGRRAGEELTNPFAAGPTHAARGQRIYRAFCASCHGVEGKGDGPVTQRGVPPPPSLLLENARNMRDGEMYHIITLGRNNMPAHAAQVDRDDRWKAILRVRELQEAIR